MARPKIRKKPPARNRGASTIVTANLQTPFGPSGPTICQPLAFDACRPYRCPVCHAEVNIRPCPACVARAAMRHGVSPATRGIKDDNDHSHGHDHGHDPPAAPTSDPLADSTTPTMPAFSVPPRIGQWLGVILGQMIGPCGRHQDVEAAVEEATERARSLIASIAHVIGEDRRRVKPTQRQKTDRQKTERRG